MKNSSPHNSRFIYFVKCSLVVFLLRGSVLSAQAFKLYAVSDLVRIFEDGYKNPPMQDTVKLFGIRGEVLSGQCIVQAKKNLTNLSIEVSALKNQRNGKTLSAADVNWDFVGSIPLTKNTPNQPLSAVTRHAPARFPDYLMSDMQLNVKEKTWQSVWLTINIPQTADAGIYTGNVIVKSGQGEQSLPVSLTIYPLTLPADRNLKVIEWYSTGDFEKHYGIREIYSDAWFAMLGKYADNMVAHRQNVFGVPMDAIEIRKSKNGVIEFDFTRFDQVAQVFWNTGKMDYMSTGELSSWGPKGWEGPEILLNDFSVKNEETGEKITIPGKDIIPLLLPSFESHLRQKGWLHKTLFGIKDEPSLHNALSWRQLSAYMHQFAPDLKRIDAIETTYLLDEIEVAVPKLDALASWYDTYKKGTVNGPELWFYTVGIFQGSLLPNKTIDMPVMDSRILHWLNYKYDAVGFLHWGWNQWTENPFQEVGEHVGDGWHVYPSKDGVLNSLRWENMRNGIQDYECFLMLEKKISALKDSLGTRFAWIDPKQRGKEIAGKVVFNFIEHSDDPQVFYKAKMELLTELIEFNTSPRIYIQTNPLVNSTLTNHSTIEVFGWTEPGTKIVINGREIPVSNQGLFLEQFGGEAIDKTKISNMQGNITINASNRNGSKEIKRVFVIK